MFFLSLFFFFDKKPYFFDVFIGGESTSQDFNSEDIVLSEYCVYIMYRNAITLYQCLHVTIFKFQYFYNYS